MSERLSTSTSTAMTHNFSNSHILAAFYCVIALTSKSNADLSVGYNDEGLASINYNDIEFYIGPGNLEDRPYIDMEDGLGGYTRIVNSNSPIEPPTGTGSDITKVYPNGVTIRFQGSQVENTLTLTWSYSNSVDNPRAIKPFYRLMVMKLSGYADVNYNEFLLGFNISLETPPLCEFLFADFSMTLTSQNNSPGAKLLLKRLNPLIQGVDSFPSQINNFTTGDIPFIFLVDFEEDNLIQPGETKTVNLKITFSDTEEELEEVRAEAIEQFQLTLPEPFNWSDRRPIATEFLTAAGKINEWLMNPRGWLNDPNLDITTEQGKLEFKTRIFERAQANITRMHEVDAQGIIVWDIEGQPNPHPISYVGDPRAISFAPEMDAIADEYFDLYKNEGFKIGVTIRPGTYQLAPDSIWSHSVIRSSDLEVQAQNLIDKIEYAVNRWGAEIFYIDSWESINTKALLSIREAFPNILLVPEWSNTDAYAQTAPYKTPLLHKQLYTPDTVRAQNAGAFSLITAPDTPKSILRYDELLENLQKGDAFLFRPWFDSEDWLLTDRLYTEAQFSAQHPELNSASVEDLLLALDSVDPAEVYRAVEELSKIEGNQTVLDRLLQVFETNSDTTNSAEDWAIARLACKALGRPGNSSAINALKLAAKASPNLIFNEWAKYHEWFAMEALSKIGGNDVNAFLNDIIQNDISYRSEYAFAAFSKGDSEDIEGILVDEIVTGETTEERAAAAFELAVINTEESKQALINALFDPEPTVVKAALEALKNFDLDRTALAGLYQSRLTLEFFFEDLVADKMIWQITGRLPFENSNWDDRWVEIINDFDIHALDLLSWWKHIPRQSYGGYRWTGQAFGNEPGIGWIYDAYWPYLFVVSGYRTQWIWIYEIETATPQNFYAYSYKEGSWILMRGDLGYYYIYRDNNTGIWRKLHN